VIKDLDKYLIMEKVELHDRSTQWCEILVAGPKSKDLLSQFVSVDLPTKEYSNIDVDFGPEKIPMSIRRVEITRPFGYLISMNRNSADIVWNLLLDAGATPCGYQAVNAARIEAGTPLVGHEITEKSLPQELARDDRAISFVKGCYLGQETVARIDALGHVNRYLVGVRFEGTDLPTTEELYSDNQIVGQITSLAYSPRLQAPLALAYVRRGGTNPGTPLQWSGGNGQVVKLPLV
jgi:folate-binding protein YgfZ